MSRGIAKSLPGYYSPGAAMKRIGISDRDVFRSFITHGKLTPVAIPGRKARMFKIEEVDYFADVWKLSMLALSAESEMAGLTFRTARAVDAQGIVNVLTSLGWKTTSAEQRKSWYRQNPEIDHVIEIEGVILGYINTMPYKKPILEGMMAGKLRGWDIKPEDILPFRVGKSYDLFVGLAERADTPQRARVGSRLVLGLRDVLRTWIGRGIFIKRMYATSAEPDGIKWAKALGFEQQKAQPDDLFGRFVLDLDISEHPFARQYREALYGAKSGGKL